VDLVLAGLPKGGAYHAAAATAGPVSLVRGDLQALPLANGAVDLVAAWCCTRCSPPGGWSPATAPC
jgi:hypothetical protein